MSSRVFSLQSKIILLLDEVDKQKHSFLGNKTFHEHFLERQNVSEHKYFLDFITEYKAFLKKDE